MRVNTTFDAIFRCLAVSQRSGWFARGKSRGEQNVAFLSEVAVTPDRLMASSLAAGGSSISIDPNCIVGIS
jgi:hypothetical protein